MRMLHRAVMLTLAIVSISFVVADSRRMPVSPTMPVSITPITPVTPIAPLRPRANIGINIGEVSDYSADMLFADVMKTWRLDRSVPADANGWPTVDAEYFIWDGSAMDHMGGTYALSFDGSATIDGSFDITNQSYDATKNLTTADATIANVMNGVLRLSDTHRNGPNDNHPNSGVTSIRLIRLGYTAANTFTSPIKRLVAPFSVIRFMDFSATNSNQQRDWSDRVTPTFATQQLDPEVNGYGWQGRGGAWEYAIQFANETGKDAWINVPAKVTDDYVRKLATLVRDGSGTFPGLRKDLKLYVEYSNELWNTGSAFRQSQDNYEAALAEVAEGKSSLNYDGEKEWQLAWRRVAKRTMEISNIFRSVFGDAQMMTRIRPILAWQQDNGQDTARAELTFLDDYYNNGRGEFVTAPHPVNYFIYGGGGSAYYNPDNDDPNLNISNIWTSNGMAIPAFEDVLRTDADWTAAFGIKRIAYEGGPALDSGKASDAVKDKAWRDDRMRQTVIDHQRAWERNGGDLLAYFNSTGNFSFGFTDDVKNLSTPKMHAVKEISAEAPTPVTYGQLMPGSIDPSNPSVFNDWDGNPETRVPPGAFYGYTFRIDTAGTFSFDVDLASAGTARLAVDGITRANVVSRNELKAAIRLEPGLHSVMIRNTFAADGTFGIKSIQVTGEANSER